MNNTKGALLSKGVLGPIVALAATIFDLSTEDQTVLVEGAVVASQAGGMLLGLIGRLFANSKIKGLL